MPFILLGKPSQHQFFEEIAAFWLTDFFIFFFSLHLFDSILQLGTEAWCIQRHPCRNVTGPWSFCLSQRRWHHAVLYLYRARVLCGELASSHLCARGCSCCCRCAELLLSGMGWVECLPLHFCFPDWPLICDHWHHRPCLSWKLKEDLALLHVTKHQSHLCILINNSTQV